MIQTVGSINAPFTTAKGQKENKLTQLAAQQMEKDNEKKELQTQKQALENQLLGLKNSADKEAVSEETQKELEKQVEEISAKLQTASVQGAKETAVPVQLSDVQKRFDSYEPQSKTESAGLYEVGQDKNGNRVIKFDTLQKETTNPTGQRELEQNGKSQDKKSVTIETAVDKSEDASKTAVAADKADESEDKSKSNGEKPVIVKTTINTDSVDREIQNLKQTKAQLAQQAAGAEPEKAKSVEAKLAQVERELQAKDNAAYRKQHADIQQTTV